LRGAYLIWLYPAAVIGFAFRPMRAVLTSVGLGVLILLLVVAGTPSAGEALRGALGTGVPALLTLGLGTWAAITINQLLVSNADLHAAREELARLAVEEERARFARDLHDLLGHTLSLIVVKLELTNRLLPQADSAAAAELRETEKLARDALRDVREVAGGYRQPTLASELAGAGVALEAAGIRMDLEKNVNVLPPEVEATVAWIVREGITNVVRHSQASVCSIRIRERKEGVMIEISDDGRGPTSSKPGIGLAGLRERVEARGGTLEWHGLEGGGFTVSASLPFTPDVAAR
jgi:two-component system sensor histidine kinase DesK